MVSQKFIFIPRFTRFEGLQDLTFLILKGFGRTHFPNQFWLGINACAMIISQAKYTPTTGIQ